MAVTKIKPIHSTLKKAVQYIVNPHKTDNYFLVDSFGCVPQMAHQEFAMTASRGTGRGSVLAFHLIQSFKPGETDPETAHKIGQEFASLVTGDRYEYVVATHMDKDHIHNHILFNAVSFVDYRKYHSNRESYLEIRKISDTLCRDYGLSVITEPVGKGISYLEWMASRLGFSYKSKMRSDVDDALSSARSLQDFIFAMKRLGYRCRQGKSLSFQPPGHHRFISLKSLGRDYREDVVFGKIAENASIKGRLRQKVPSDRTAIHRLSSFNRNMEQLGLKDISSLHLALSHQHFVCSGLREQIQKLEKQHLEMVQFLNYDALLKEHQKVYREYLSSGRNRDFYEKHRMDILVYEQALVCCQRSSLFSSGVSVSQLQEKSSVLKSRLDGLRQEYARHSERLKNLRNLKKTADELFPEIRKDCRKNPGKGKSLE